MKKTLDSIRFGIEIEVEFPQVENSWKLIEKNRLIRGWEMDYDGTLDNGAEYRPLNKNKLYYNEDCIDQIKEVIGLIKAHKGHIRPSCGLHIHIDTKKFAKEEIINIVKAFYKAQNKIYKDFKVIKSREINSAKKLEKQIIKALNTETIIEIKKGRDYIFLDRDSGLNLCALAIHNTLEFRFFNGTIQVRNIKNNIKWAIEFCITNSQKNNELKNKGK